MSDKMDPKATTGAQIWQRIEALRIAMDGVYTAFDNLYGYIYWLKEESRKRAEQQARDSAET